MSPGRLPVYLEACSSFLYAPLSILSGVKTLSLILSPMTSVRKPLPNATMAWERASSLLIPTLLPISIALLTSSVMRAAPSIPLLTLLSFSVMPPIMLSTPRWKYPSLSNSAESTVLLKRSLKVSLTFSVSLCFCISGNAVFLAIAISWGFTKALFRLVSANKSDATNRLLYCSSKDFF